MDEFFGSVGIETLERNYCHGVICSPSQYFINQENIHWSSEGIVYTIYRTLFSKKITQSCVLGHCALSEVAKK